MNNKESISYLKFESPLGWIAVAAGSEGLCELSFHDAASPQSSELDLSLAAAYPQHVYRPDAHQPLLEDVKNAILRYFSHHIPLPSFPLDLRAGTPFQKTVWDSLCAIPFGQTRSYAEIAGSIGNPKGMRAVGQACGRNPVAILVPCHRVISRHGKLGGFSGGLHIKKALLELEQSNLGSQRSV
jgi:methylated-DNA-[protein]-cysteine S-methyltransferase